MLSPGECLIVKIGSFLHEQIDETIKVTYHRSNTSMSFQMLIALHTFCWDTIVGGANVVRVAGVTTEGVGCFVVAASMPHLQEVSGQSPFAQ